MTVRLWVVVAVAAVAGMLVTITGYTAVHYAGAARDAHATIRAAAKLRADNERASRLRYQPVPELRSVSVYGAPWFVTVVCTVKGSSAAGDTRVPLDPQAAPAPGDVFVKTCRGLAPSEAPTG